jgi:hypothetical protein
MKKFAIAAAGALCILAGAPAASYGLAGDYAKGRGGVAGEKFSFLAQGTGLADRADGKSVDSLTVADPNITVSGDVTCLLIIGRDAFIGGRITDFKPAGAAGFFNFAQGFAIFAEDNAKPSNGLDRYGYTTLPTPPADCTEAMAAIGSGSPVITGDIEIVPGTP